MKMQIKSASGVLSMLLMLMLWSVCNISLDVSNVSAQQAPSKATIAVLSHTDFLPDATGVYDRRSWHGRDKNANFAANNDLKTGSDQAYDNVNRGQGYDPESVGLPEILADAILEQLSKSKRFIPVERKALRTSLLEQRFGEDIKASYLDRTLDKAIQDMDKFEIGGGMAADPTLKASKFNDLLHDFKDLGSAIGAQYIVVGNLHMLGTRQETAEVPYSDSNRQTTKKLGEARLRLRVIDAQSSTVTGADSLHLKVSSMIFEGGPAQTDDFDFLDQVSKEAAQKILDMTFPGKLLSVEPLVISRGKNDGVILGDEFAILREGKEIKEQSGTVIARLKEPVGKVKVIEVQDTVSIVSPEEGTGFANGDLAVPVSMGTQGKQEVAKESTVPLQRPSDSPTKQLPRVAVGLVKVGSTAKTGEDADKHVPIFTDTIISRLVQSKRFTVIDRQEVDQLINEQYAQALVENRDLPSGMGTLKGCDYLLIGSLQNFSMEENSIKFPNSSKVIEVLDGFSEGNMRLVDARSGDIMESRKIVVEEQLDIDTGEDRLIAALADRFAAEVVANLLNAVYPIKVAAVADGIIYANRGADGMLNQGAVFDVLRPGQKITDPDTNVVLGTIESKVGQMQLTVVEDNRSTGKMIDGSIAQKGDLLKMVSAGTAGNSQGPADRSGGMLPGSVSSQSGAVVNQQMKREKPTLALTKIIVNESLKVDAKAKNFTFQNNTLEMLTDEIIDALAKTNRFTMMERGQIDQVLDEKTFQAISKGGNIRDYLKELEGSDYLVIGILNKFVLSLSKEKVPYLNESANTVQAVAEGNIRIVDGHNSRIIATEEVRIRKKYKNLKIEEAHSRLVDSYAMESAAGIVDRLYPMRILTVTENGTIFVNRGADVGIKIGSTFSVERPGKDLVDKDTGVIFGQVETTIGSLKITSVEASRSRAEMLSGDTPLEGDILRNKALPVKPKPEPKKKVAW